MTILVQDNQSHNLVNGVEIKNCVHITQFEGDSKWDVLDCTIPYGQPGRRRIFKRYDLAFGYATYTLRKRRKMPYGFYR